MSNKSLSAHSSQPVIKHGSIANGYTDIASHLGYDAKDVYFMHSLVTDPLDPHDRKLCATDDLDIRGMQYSLSLTAAGSNAFHFPVDPAHCNHLKTYVSQGNLIEVQPVDASRLHPGGSIPAALLQGTDVTYKQKMIVNSYVTKEVEAFAVANQASVLMNADTYLPFVSKAYVHEVANKADIPVAPGFVFDTSISLDEFNATIRDLHKAHQSKKPSTWLKAAALSGGQGISKSTDLSKETISAHLNGIAQGYRDAGFSANTRIDKDNPFSDMQYFMPIVAEIDINSLPDVKRIVINSGVQAVVASQAITMTGTTLQKTVAGEYVGGIMPRKEDMDAVRVAEQAAVKFLKQAHKDGYRGYGGVDVIVAETQKGDLKPFVLEFNPRLTGSTPLLRLVQNTKQEIGSAFGQIASMALPEKNGSVQDIYAKLIGNDLFAGEKTGFTGVLPTMIDRVEGRNTVFRLVTLGRDEEQVHDLSSRINKKLKRLSR